MDEERKPWERMEGESLRWHARFDKFRRMKPWERSINAVFEEEKIQKTQEKPRGNAGKEWYEAANKYHWHARVEAWDKHRIEERDKQIALEEAEVMKAQYALKHERIKDLNDVAKLLREELFDDDKRWVDDVKAVGIEAHHLKQFNDGLIREYRATLDDIAKETGERVKTTKSELSGKVDGEHIEKVLFYMPVVDEEDNAEVKESDTGADDSNSESSQD